MSIFVKTITLLRKGPDSNQGMTDEEGTLRGPRTALNGLEGRNQ